MFLRTKFQDQKMWETQTWNEFFFSPHTKTMSFDLQKLEEILKQCARVSENIFSFF